MDSIEAIYARAHVRAPMETIHIRYKSNSDTRAAIDIIDVIINTRVASGAIRFRAPVYRLEQTTRREQTSSRLSPLCTFLSR